MRSFSRGEEIFIQFKQVFSSYGFENYITNFKGKNPITLYLSYFKYVIKYRFLLFPTSGCQNALQMYQETSVLYIMYQVGDNTIEP